MSKVPIGQRCDVQTAVRYGVQNHRPTDADVRARAEAMEEFGGDSIEGSGRFSQRYHSPLRRSGLAKQPDEVSQANPSHQLLFVSELVR